MATQPDPLVVLHHLGTHTSTLCAMLGVSLSPTLTALQDRLQQQAVQKAQLAAMNAELLDLVQESQRAGAEESLG